MLGKYSDILFLRVTQNEPKYDFRGACAVKGNVRDAGHVKRVDYGQSRESRAKPIFNYDVIGSQVAGSNHWPPGLDI